MRDDDSIYFSRFSVDPDSDFLDMDSMEDFNHFDAAIAKDLEIDVYTHASYDSD